MGMPPGQQDPWGGFVRSQTPLSPAALAAASGSPSAIPPALNPSNQALLNAPNQAMQPQSDLWSRLMSMVGNQGLPRMPGTTVGAPAGQTPPALPPPPVFPGQGQAPPGMGAYFRQQQFPTAAGGAGNNSQLMAQYMALQQLMRGS